MIPIYIPSRSRAFTLKSSIISRLPEEFDPYLAFVVPGSQAELYAAALENMGRKINVWDSGERKLHDKRLWIGQLCQRLGQKKFVMCDDDITSWATRISETDYHLRPSTKEDLIDMFSWIEQSLDTHVHSSISPRGNNYIRNKSGAMVGPKPLTLENVRTIRLLAYRTEEFLSVEHGRVLTKEDMDINLQLLKKGYPNIQSYWWTQDQKSSALPGGCADYRTMQVHADGVKKLAELHPGFISIKQKNTKSNKTDWASRIDVIVQWKKAYESSFK